MLKKEENEYMEKFRKEKIIEDAQTDIWESCRNLGQYTAYERMHAVLMYVLYPSDYQVAKRTGIPRGTIQSWRSNKEWWRKALIAAKKVYKEQLRGKLTQIAEKGGDEQLDRLENGDAKLTKDGQIIRVPVSARDAAMMTAIAYDKIALMDGDPTSRTASSSSQEGQLAEMRTLLQDIAKAHKAKDITDEVEVTIVDNDDK